MGKTTRTVRRLSTRYLLLGILTGLLVSVGLFVSALWQARSFDPWEIFAMTAAGSMLTLGVAGWMIGRRDDVLAANPGIAAFFPVPCSTTPTMRSRTVRGVRRSRRRRGSTDVKSPPG